MRIKCSFPSRQLAPSALQWAQKRAAAKPRLDFAAEVRDAKNKPRRRCVARHHHCKNRHRALPGFQQRSLVYQGGIILSPVIQTKILARENESAGLARSRISLFSLLRCPTACNSGSVSCQPGSKRCKKTAQNYGSSKLRRLARMQK